MDPAINKSEYLQQVLESHRMKHVDKLMRKYISKRNQIKEALENKYGAKIASSAINSGSYAKHTAINIKFDIDLCQPFMRDAFATLEEMVDDLYNYFLNEYIDLELIKSEIRKQRVSIGLTFLIDGEYIKMDIVPGRELTQDNYTKSNNLNLYVRAKGSASATSTQTNIQKHIEHISGKNEERQIIRLLKIWRSKNNKDVKPFFLELITIRAFEDNAGKVPSGLWEKLEMAMKYIRDKVESIRMEDPANSNNVVSDTLNAFEKKNLSEDMRRMLERIDGNSEMIRMYFPVNDKFAEKNDDKRSGTVLKTQSFS